MPKALERKLKAEYGADSKVPYKIMNAMGVMHGNQETAKGRAIDAKSDADHPSKNLGKHLLKPGQRAGHHGMINERHHRGAK